MPNFTSDALRMNPAAFNDDIQEEIIPDLTTAYIKQYGKEPESNADLVALALDNIAKNVRSKYEYHLSFFTMWYPLKALLGKYGHDFGGVTRDNEVEYFGQGADELTLIAMALKCQEYFRLTYFEGTESVQIIEYSDAEVEDLQNQSNFDEIDFTGNWALNDTDMRQLFETSL
jgi:hypothetical protein